MSAASHSLHWISYAKMIATRSSLPDLPSISAAAMQAGMLSLGCPGSFERYVSLKSKYLIIIPFTNAAISVVVRLPVPKRVAEFPE